MAEIFIPDEQEFREIIRETVGDILNESLPRILRKAKQKTWMSPKEAMDFLGINSRQLQYMRNEKQIPFSQDGRTIFYPTKGLEDYLRSNMPERWQKYLDGEIEDFSSN